jgi:Holliday junction resolvase RusA-like endonuclease
MINLTIYGTPSPQAGMRAVNTPRGARMITTGGKHLKPWRTAIAEAAAEQAAIHGCQTAPLHVTVQFRFPMPKSAPKHDRDHASRLRATTPDLDKLVRGLFDGFTAGGLIADDRQVVSLCASKIDVWQQWLGAGVVISEAVPL